MADDRPEDVTPPDPGRARREPPTIELEATEVSTEPQNTDAGAAEPEPSAPRPPRSATATAIIGAISGASAAALVIGAAWLGGWTAPTVRWGISRPVPSPAPRSWSCDDPMTTGTVSAGPTALALPMSRQ